MSLIKWSPVSRNIDPFSMFDNVDRALSTFGLSNISENFVPSLDIYQTDDEVIVEVALAGINPEDVEVGIENNVLTIEGNLDKKSEVEEKNYYRREIRQGQFHRTVALPTAVDSSAAVADFSKGTLKITIPKQEEAKSKKVKINVKND